MKLDKILIICIFIFVICLIFFHILGRNKYKEGFSLDISGSVVAIPSTDTDASGNPYEITNVTQNQTSNYDNYNHFMQTSTNTNIINGTTFYGPMGETAQFYTTANGTQIFKLTINQFLNSLAIA